MLTGEKQMIIDITPSFISCDKDHVDNVPVRVKGLTVDVSRPDPKEKSPVLRTSDL